MPFFFENEQEETVSVNGNRYRALLNEFLFTRIEFRRILATFDFNRMVLRAEATHDVLRPVFEDRIISRRADIVWPPRSSDLTPLN